MGSDSVRHVQGNYTILSLKKKVEMRPSDISHKLYMQSLLGWFFLQNGKLILIVSELIRYNLVCMFKDYIRNTDLDLWRYIVE